MSVSKLAPCIHCSCSSVESSNGGAPVVDRGPPMYAKNRQTILRHSMSNRLISEELILGN
jgi:hypothetical protein